MNTYFFVRRTLIAIGVMIGVVGVLAMSGGLTTASPPLAPPNPLSPREAGKPHQVILSPAPDESPDSSTPAAEKRVLGRADDGYQSSPVEEQIPFTHMLLKWEVDNVALRDNLEVHVRVSEEGEEWTAWQVVDANHHLWLPEDGEATRWSNILYAGEGMRFWQVRAIPAPAATGDAPAIKNIVVNTVDARFGPPNPSASPLNRPSDNEPHTIEKPPVVSRTAWGCLDGQGSRVPPAYRFATHMIVHHTAGSNNLRGSEQSWADRVRAIWSFHTYTRGWGDIGYNYILDPNGTVYEARAGGENAVGFHDTCNYGSMGVSLIGTYSTIEPPAAALDSLVELLAWKAYQHDIDPLGRAYYYGCDISRYCEPYNAGAVVETLAGHRHVTPGHTTCPGDGTVNLLPAIRNRVKSYIEQGGESSQQPDNGDLLIDELEDTFTRSEANWYSASCGYGDHTFYTYTTDSEEESTNKGSWQPTIPTTGNYQLYAHIPQGCGLASPPYASTNATYRIHSADGVAEQTVDHTTAEEWVDLGIYRFEAGKSGYVELDDLTGEPYSDRRVLFFDTVKWISDTTTTEPPQQPIELPEVSYSPSEVAVGELLTVTFTIRNNKTITMTTQDPEAGILPDGDYDPRDGYVYHEEECFLGREDTTYPAYPKELERYRLMLGSTNRTIPCSGNTNGYPWRWGLNGALLPGETRPVTGYIVFSRPGTVTLHVGVIQEYVEYPIRDAAPKQITVTDEAQPPVLVSYDALLRSLAHVYRLGDIPGNFLDRTSSPATLPRTSYVGSFAWQGDTLRWEEHGPFGVSDRFLIEQTRVITVPIGGEYMFRTISNDSSWLWIDGHTVVTNTGLLDPPDSSREMTGTIMLQPGWHVLSFAYFEQEGVATTGYAMRIPGSTDYMTPTDAISSAFSSEISSTIGRVTGSALRDAISAEHERVSKHSTAPVLHTTTSSTPTIAIGADDQGGSGVANLHYSWDYTHWTTVPISEGQTASPALLRLTLPTSGTNQLWYWADDRVGNRSAMQKLRLTTGQELFLPLIVN